MKEIHFWWKILHHEVTWVIHDICFNGTEQKINLRDAYSQDIKNLKLIKVTIKIARNNKPKYGAHFFIINIFNYVK